MILGASGLPFTKSYQKGSISTASSLITVPGFIGTTTLNVSTRSMRMLFGEAGEGRAAGEGNGAPRSAESARLKVMPAPTEPVTIFCKKARRGEDEEAVRPRAAKEPPACFRKGATIRRNI